MSSGAPLVKAIWTEADFDQMGWHDCAVHALAVEPAPPCPGRLLVDLDYIVEWVCPTPPATGYNFWMCPATLVFDDAWDLAGDINLQGFSFDLLSFDALERSGPDKHGAFEWTLAGHGLSLTLRASGFTQYLRRPPIPSPHQRLSIDQRGGFSFDRQGYAH